MDLGLQFDICENESYSNLNYCSKMKVKMKVIVAKVGLLYAQSSI